MRTKALLALLALVVLAVVFFATRGGDEDAPDTTVTEDSEGSPERRRRRANWSDEDDDGYARSDDPRDRTSRRAESEEERRARFEALVDIVSLGPSPVTLTPRTITDALRAVDEDFENCIDAAGGRVAYRTAMRAVRRTEREARAQTEASLTEAERAQRRAERIAARNGGPYDRFMRFDVRPDGTVDPESIELEPQVPEPFAACFVTRLESLNLASVGPEGARVEMPMRGPMRRNADAGMPLPPPPTPPLP